MRRLCVTYFAGVKDQGSNITMSCALEGFRCLKSRYTCDNNIGVIFKILYQRCSQRMVTAEHHLCFKIRSCCGRLRIHWLTNDLSPFAMWCIRSFSSSESHMPMLQCVAREEADSSDTNDYASNGPGMCTCPTRRPLDPRPRRWRWRRRGRHLKSSHSRNMHI